MSQKHKNAAARLRQQLESAARTNLAIKTALVDRAKRAEQARDQARAEAREEVRQMRARLQGRSLDDKAPKPLYAGSVTLHRHDLEHIAYKVAVPAPASPSQYRPGEMPRYEDAMLSVVDVTVGDLIERVSQLERSLELMGKELRKQRDITRSMHLHRYVKPEVELAFMSRFGEATEAGSKVDADYFAAEALKVREWDRG